MIHYFRYFSFTLNNKKYIVYCYIKNTIISTLIVSFIVYF